MPHLIIRCDGNDDTGLGHVTRCADLAVALLRHQPGAEIVFRGNYAAAAQRILAHHRLPFEQAARDALPASLQDLPSSAPVFIDSYRLTSAALAALGASGRTVGLFDDFGSVSGEGAALAVNFRVGAAGFANYRARRVGLGPGYFPARSALEAVRGAREVEDVTPDFRRILLFIGGTDHFSVGAALAKIVARRFHSSEILWVSLQAPTSPLPENVRFLPFQDELGPWLRDTDLVIAGGGRLKYEAAYALVPCASVAQTAEQGLDTTELVGAGVCSDLGDARALELLRIEAELDRLSERSVRRRMVEEQRRAFPRDCSRNLAELVAESLGLRDIAPGLGPA